MARYGGAARALAGQGSAGHGNRFSTRRIGLE